MAEERALQGFLNYLNWLHNAPFEYHFQVYLMSPQNDKYIVFGAQFFNRQDIKLQFFDVPLYQSPHTQPLLGLIYLSGPIFILYGVPEHFRILQLTGGSRIQNELDLLPIHLIRVNSWAGLQNRNNLLQPHLNRAPSGLVFDADESAKS